MHEMRNNLSNLMASRLQTGVTLLLLWEEGVTAGIAFLTPSFLLTVQRYGGNGGKASYLC